MPITRTEISSSEARQVVDAAIARAENSRLDITVAVCDSKGTLVAFGRTDDVIVPAVEFAIDKAYTAATLGQSSESFGERMASKKALGIGLGNRDRMTSWAGGVPVFFEGQCIGGVGVSGARDHEDVECARAAIMESGLSAEA